MEILDQQRFEQWLEVHPDTIFEAGHSFRCPLAQYLTDVLDTTTQVGIFNAFYGGILFDNVLSLPDWARSFMSVFDSLGDPNDPSLLVSGKTALEVWKAR